MLEPRLHHLVFQDRAFSCIGAQERAPRLHHPSSPCGPSRVYPCQGTDTLIALRRIPGCPFLHNFAQVHVSLDYLTLKYKAVRLRDTLFVRMSRQLFFLTRCELVAHALHIYRVAHCMIENGLCQDGLLNIIPHPMSRPRMGAHNLIRSGSNE